MNSQRGVRAEVRTLAVREAEVAEQWVSSGGESRLGVKTVLRKR